MRYIDYINLGFERIELDSNIAYEEVGIKEFKLVKQLRNEVVLEVQFDKLDKPQMIVPFGFRDRTFYRINITSEDARNLAANENKVTCHEQRAKPETHH